MSQQAVQLDLCSKRGVHYRIKYHVDSSNRILIYFKRKKAFGIFQKWKLLDICEHEVFIEQTLFKHFGYTSSLFYKTRKKFGYNGTKSK